MLNLINFITVSKYFLIPLYFEEIITDYIAILDKICTDGVVSGNVHDNLVVFKIYASLLSGQLDAILGMASRICTDFVADIDVADSDLY